MAVIGLELTRLLSACILLDRCWRRPQCALKTTSTTGAQAWGSDSQDQAVCSDCGCLYTYRGTYRDAGDFVCFFETVLLYSPGWPRTCNPPVSTSRVEELPMCTTTWIPILWPFQTSAPQTSFEGRAFERCFSPVCLFFLKCYVSGWSVCIYVCVSHVCLLPAWGRQKALDPWNWGYRCELTCGCWVPNPVLFKFS